MQTPNVIYNIKGLREPMLKDLEDLVKKNLEVKMQSSLKKIYSKGDYVKVVIRISILKVSDGYDGNFKFEFNGGKLEYERKGFEILSDLVNHAFDNFKLRLLAK